MPPWGVARGGILDVGLIEDGVIGQDFFSLADFIPNNWSSWPTTYQRVSVAEQTSDKVIIRTERDWGDVSLETTFTIRANDSRITIDNIMKNDGDTDLDNLLSGFVAWPNGGYLFGVPGLSSFSVDETDEASALADWSVGYDRTWVFGLHAPYSETIRNFGRDRYKRHDLAVGGTQSFSAVLQF